MLKYFILFLGLSVSLFILVLLFRKQKKQVPDYLLISWYFTAFSHLAFYFLGFNYWLKDQHLIIALGNSFPVLHIFINALYLDSLRGKPLKRYVKIFGATYLLYVCMYYTMSYSNMLIQEGILLTFSPKAPFWAYIIPPSYLILYLVTGAYILRSIQSYQFNLKSIYSDAHTTEVNWLGYWLWSYGIGSVIILLSVFLMDFHVISLNTAYIGICAVLSLQVFLVGQFGVTNNFTFLNASDKYTKYRASGLKEGQKQLGENRLKAYLKASKPFLNPNLSLHQLAKSVEMPPYQLSQLINETLGTSFYELINQYRVEEFKALLQNPDNSHLSILGIALEAGFNSKSGFYKAFKKQMGMNPSEYKKSLK